MNTVPTYEDAGELELAGADEANIPVNSFIYAPDEESKRWRWTADNFMPRKCRCAEGIYEIHADSREAILDAVKKHVVPIYEAALHNLNTAGECYYWERK